MSSTNIHHQLKKEITSFINQNDGVLKRKGERPLKKLEKKVQRLEKEKDPIFQKKSLSARKGWETRRKKLPQSAFVARSAHHGRARDYTIKNHISINPENFLKRSKNEAFRVLGNHLPNKTSFKLQCIFEHLNNSTGDRREVEQYLGTSAMVILAENSMEEVYERATNDILEKIFSFTNEESGWRLKNILGLHLYVNDYNPIGGSSYKELSDYFKRKKCLINVKNNDNQCGKWAITIALNMPQKNREKVTSQTKENSEKYNWDGITFPMTEKDLETFEKNNKHIALIVFVAIGKKEIAPLYQSKRLNQEKIATLFVYEDHYCVVTNENALLLREEQKNGTLACTKCMATFLMMGNLQQKKD